MSVQSDLKRGWNLPGDSAPVEFSDHAIERFNERLRPALDADDVRAELCRLLATAVITARPPEWFRDSNPKRRRLTRAFLLMADGEIVMPLMPNASGGDELVASTVLTPELRSRPTATKKPPSRRSINGRRTAPGPSADEWTDL